MLVLALMLAACANQAAPEQVVLPLTGKVQAYTSGAHALVVMDQFADTEGYETFSTLFTGEIAEDGSFSLTPAPFTPRGTVGVQFGDTGVTVVGADTRIAGFAMIMVTDTDPASGDNLDIVSLLCRASRREALEYYEYFPSLAYAQVGDFAIWYLYASGPATIEGRSRWGMMSYDVTLEEGWNALKLSVTEVPSVGQSASAHLTDATPDGGWFDYPFTIWFSSGL